MGNCGLNFHSTWSDPRALADLRQDETLTCKQHQRAHELQETPHNSLEACGLEGFETKRKWWYNLKKKGKKWACLFTFPTPRSRKTGQVRPLSHISILKWESSPAYEQAFSKWLQNSCTFQKYLLVQLPPGREGHMPRLEPTNWASWVQKLPRRALQTPDAGNAHCFTGKPS